MVGIKWSIQMVFTADYDFYSWVTEGGKFLQFFSLGNVLEAYQEKVSLEKKNQI